MTQICTHTTQHGTHGWRINTYSVTQISTHATQRGTNGWRIYTDSVTQIRQEKWLQDCGLFRCLLLGSVLTWELRCFVYQCLLGSVLTWELRCLSAKLWSIFNSVAPSRIYKAARFVPSHEAYTLGKYELWGRRLIYDTSSKLVILITYSLGSNFQ